LFIGTWLRLSSRFVTNTQYNGSVTDSVTTWRLCTGNTLIRKMQSLPANETQMYEFLSDMLKPPTMTAGRNVIMLSIELLQ